MKGRIFLFFWLLHVLTVSSTQISPEPTSSRPLSEFCGGSLFDTSDGVPGNDTYLWDYRWMVALGFKTGPMPSFTLNPQFFKSATADEISFRCSGSVISERYVLTVAYCVTPKKPDVIRLGEWDLETDVDCTNTTSGFLLCSPQPARDVEYEEIVVHPTYGKRGSLSDNIALIRLAEPIDFKKNWMIRPVCLPEPDFNVQDGATATVTGWEFTNRFSNVLLKEKLVSVDADRCPMSIRGTILEGQICFRSVDGSLCGGDSGSPVVMPYGSVFVQVGIYSHVQHPLCPKHVPMVFTSVVTYRDWIEQTIRQH